MVPLSLQNGKRFACFPLVQLFPFYRKTFCILPLTAFLFFPHRQQTTFAAFILSPERETFRMLSFVKLFCIITLCIRRHSVSPLVIRMVSQSLSPAHQLCFPLFKRSGINYPPSDKQMVPLSLQKGVTCCLLSFARRSVYPERMYVGALTSSWQVGAIPQELQGYGFCE